MNKLFSVLLLFVFSTFAQCLFSTSKVEGNTIILYGECIHQNVLENVYFIDEFASTLVFKTKSGKEYRYFKSNITGYEILNESEDEIVRQVRK